MKITIPEIEEYGDIIETLNDLPKSVRIKIIIQAIREYKDSAEGGAVINLLRKQQKQTKSVKKSGGDIKAISSPETSPLKKIMGGFIE
jgi:hypothetical protein